VIRTFGYLYGTSLRNSLAQRFKRLRQPKYLVGAVAGGLYFYFVVFRNAFRGLGAGAPVPPGLASASPLLEPLAAAALLIVVVLSWILSNRRAALQFSEAEVAFLFPAPVSRRSLINFKLLRSQLAIFVSAFFLTLVFRRGTLFGGNALTHAAGWWLILSTLDLHFLAASFARERLLDFGLNPWRRRLVVGGVVVAIAAVCWLVVRRTVPLPTDADLAGPRSIAHYVGAVLGHAPISWVLAPFALVVRPYLATSAPAFFIALVPALLLMLLHYYWVVRSTVSFEEASIDLAARRAERIAAARSGRWRSGRNAPTKPRSEPFRLAARGWVPLAFLWKNLIALGTLFRLRTWLIACAVAMLALRWIASDPARLPVLQIIGAVTLMLGGWLFLFGPMFMRREVQQTLTHLDITKSYPLAGWQVVIGQLLTPVVLMTFGQWLLLLISALSLGATTHNPWLATLLGAAGAGGIALIMPPLCGLLLCIPYSGVLFFPAWAQSTGPRGGGVEVMGQRLIFMAGYLVVLVVAVLPAAAIGALVFFIINALVGLIPAMILTTICVSAVLSAELAGAVYWLGEKVERFDLSTELPR
jgi:hypothetical protein